LGRTQNQIWAITITTTGGWPPIRAASKLAIKLLTYPLTASFKRSSAALASTVRI
jgi:hypothetical protein